jgi:hypothetical protein
MMTILNIASLLLLLVLYKKRKDRERANRKKRFDQNVERLRDNRWGRG